MLNEFNKFLEGKGLTIITNHDHLDSALKKNWDLLVEFLKEKIAEDYGGNPRPWLEMVGKSSYEDIEYKTRLFVLEGSPPKSYVIQTPTFIHGLDVRGKIQYRIEKSAL